MVDDAPMIPLKPLGQRARMMTAPAMATPTKKPTPQTPILSLETGGLSAPQATQGGIGDEQNPLNRLFQREVKAGRVSVPAGQRWWIEPAVSQQGEFLCAGEAITWDALGKQASRWQLTAQPRQLPLARALVKLARGESATEHTCSVWVAVTVHHQIPSLVARQTLHPGEPLTTANTLRVMTDLPNPHHYVQQLEDGLMVRTIVREGQTVKRHQVKPRPDVLRLAPVQLVTRMPGGVNLVQPAVAQQDGVLGQVILIKRQLPKDKVPKAIRATVIGPNRVMAQL